MRGASLVLAAALAASPLRAAEGLPALFDVTGVAGSDVLNIRARPDGSAEVIGSLAADARGIEVTGWSADGRWARVNSGESAGWVARRFLAEAGGPAWFEPEAHLACSGTEPFWDLMLTDGTGAFRLPLGDSGPQAVTVTGRGRVSGVVEPPLGLAFDGGFATIRPAECGDGMSDRTMALAIELFLAGHEGLAGYTGCCSIAP